MYTGGPADGNDGTFLNPDPEFSVYPIGVFEAFLEFVGWGIIAIGVVVAAVFASLAIPRNPMRNWLSELLKRFLAAGAAGAYVLSPIDLIPDLVPLVGQMDDLTVILLLIYYWYTMVSPAKPGQTPRPFVGRATAPHGQGEVIDIQADEVR